MSHWQGRSIVLGSLDYFKGGFQCTTGLLKSQMYLETIFRIIGSDIHVMEILGTIRHGHMRVHKLAIFMGKLFKMLMLLLEYYIITTPASRVHN